MNTLRPSKGICFLEPRSHEKPDRTQAVAKHRARAADSRMRKSGSKWVRQANWKEKEGVCRWGPSHTPRDPILFLAETKEQKWLQQGPSAWGQVHQTIPEIFDNLKRDDFHDVYALGWRLQKGNCVPKSSQIQVSTKIHFVPSSSNNLGGSVPSALFPKLPPRNRAVTAYTL